MGCVILGKWLCPCGSVPSDSIKQVHRLVMKLSKWIYKALRTLPALVYSRCLLSLSQGLLGKLNQIVYGQGLLVLRKCHFSSHVSFFPSLFHCQSTREKAASHNIFLPKIYFLWQNTHSIKFSEPFLNIQFSGIKYLHNIVQPPPPSISLTFFIL